MEEVTLQVINALEEQDVGTLASLIKSHSFPPDFPAESSRSLLDFLVYKLNSKFCRKSLDWLEKALQKFPASLSHELEEACRACMESLQEDTPALSTLHKLKGKLDMLTVPIDGPEPSTDAVQSASSSSSLEAQAEYELFSDSEES